MSDSANREPSETDLFTTVGAIDEQLSHVWMVRTFLKHSDEAVDDEELRNIVRDLYDYILALAPAKQADDEEGYLKMAKKKLGKLRAAQTLFVEIQPEVSNHTNFEMAAKSVTLAVDQIERLLQK